MENHELINIFETHYKKFVQFDRHLGMELRVEAPGKISYSLELKEHHLTSPDSVHGGVAAAMMDATLGLAAMSHAITKGNLCATVEFKINYLMQARPGHTLISQGKVKHIGKRLIVSEADILEKETGELVASGLGTFTQYPVEKSEGIQSTIGMEEIHNLIS